jgi:hypothetical protein
VFLFHFRLKTVIQKGIFAFGAFHALNGEAFLVFSGISV